MTSIHAVQRANMQKRTLFLIAGLVAVGILALVMQYTGGDRRPLFASSEITITRADGERFLLPVEVADTANEKNYGLMFKSSMPRDEGMIFVYDPPERVSYWMKNTLIPLDILFVRADGRIARIVANAQPNDLSPIDSLIPVAVVVEVNAGVVQEYGLQAGDKISSPLLKATQ